MSRRSLLLLTPVLAAAATSACAAPDPGSAAAPSADASATPSAPEPTPAGELEKYSYGDHPSQYAELTLPAGTDPVPVVVVVHGGFWRAAYGAELGQPLAADLATRGWAALNVEYRRVGGSRTTGGGGWPTTMEDVAAAVDSLAEQGQDLAGGRLDLTRVVGLGHSAGGQLVGWLGARSTLPAAAPGAEPEVPLTGVVAQAGVMDLVSAAQNDVGGTAVPDLMGGTPDRRKQAYDWASPIARVPLGVPSVCVHGTSDENVPLSQSESFVAAAKQAGDDSELQVFDGDHYDLITVGTAAWTLCTDAITRLFAR